MYSVVMMMAMAGAPETPAFGFRRNGCDGGCRGYSAGCCGYVDNCGCGGGRGGLFGRRHRGCVGGCGGYTAGCGCCGVMNNCCHASCGCCGQMNCCNTCNACDACGGCGGVAPAMPATPAPPAMPPKDSKPTAMNAAPAALVVSLPADATLTINGVATSQTSDVRRFATPTLTAGQTFYYTLTAEVVRDGQTLTSVQTVTVRAGETTAVSIPAEQFGLAVASR